MPKAVMLKGRLKMRFVQKDSHGRAGGRHPNPSGRQLVAKVQRCSPGTGGGERQGHD